MIDNHVDYKKLYLKMARATEEALHIIMETHRECKEIYLENVNQQIEDLYAVYKAGGGTMELDDMEMDIGFGISLEQIEDETY